MQSVTPRKRSSKKIKSITVIGRRWFRRTYGNTYCTAQILLNGETVHTTERQYGYGDFYIQAAFEWLEDQGKIKREHHDNGSTDAPWRWCQDRGIKLEYSAIDVSRENDL